MTRLHIRAGAVEVPVFQNSRRKRVVLGPDNSLFPTILVRLLQKGDVGRHDAEGRRCRHGRFAGRRCLLHRVEKGVSEASERLIDFDVAFDAVEQPACAELRDACVEVSAELAEVRVVPVAECEHGEAQAGKRRAGSLIEHRGEAPRAIGRLSFAVRARDQGDMPERREGGDIERAQIAGARFEALLPGRPGELLRHPFRGSGLRGEQRRELRLCRGGFSDRRRPRREQPGEEAVQPSPLRRRKRRILGQ